MSLYDGVVGQERATAQLRASVTAPVHAYLLEGPPGSGKRAAARAFAASLLCEQGGCGTCPTCRLVGAEAHPDLRVVEPEGAFITADQAKEIIRCAVLSPAQKRRTVLLLIDFHLVHPRVAPKLLKIIEEPPPLTVFLIVTEHVPPELVTIASRCSRIEFRLLDKEVIAAALVAEGMDPAAAGSASEMAGGRLDRARLLASDPGFGDRRRMWRSLPGRLDGTGAAVAIAVSEIVAAIDAAAGPLETRHVGEAEVLQERIERYGERGSGRSAQEARHKKEMRRLRTDEVRFGLATLAGVYRHAAGSAAPATFVEALGTVQRAAESLIRNPIEGLLLESLLLRLPALDPTLV